MKDIADMDYTDPVTCGITLLLLCLIVFMRYIILSETYHWLVYKAFKRKFSRRILFAPVKKRRQIKKEVVYSLYSAIIFSVTGMALLVLWQLGYTQLYTDIHAYPLWYIPVSILLFLFLHDLYYYWLHKWMHTSPLLRRYHMVHHQSVDTTVFTSFSFHPVESVLQAVIVPVILMIIPMSLVAVLITLLLMTVSAIINHAGVEVYPSGKKLSFIRRHVIGATHHNHHHKNARKNYGLYFTFWDKLMKTEW